MKRENPLDAAMESIVSDLRNMPRSARRAILLDSGHFFRFMLKQHPRAYRRIERSGADPDTVLDSMRRRLRSTIPNPSPSSAKAKAGKGVKTSGEHAIEISKQSAKNAKNRNTRIAKSFLHPWMLSRFNPGDVVDSGIPFFLASTSAKMLHTSQEKKEWINVVLYHAPADRALLSFFKKYHGELWIFDSIRKNIREAALENAAWKPLAVENKAAWERFHEQFDKLTSSRKMEYDYALPSTNNSSHFFTTCPFASPNCRAMCLNSSGQSSFDLVRHDIARVEKVHQAYSRRAGKLRPGYTFTDDAAYFMLKGTEALYGGTLNHSQASRIRRTHLMWLSWAMEGVIENSYNDMLFYEALDFRRKAKQRGLKYMALRLNGTSDFPVWTLRLKNAVDENKKSLKGRLLIEELGKRGIICYDYTKNPYAMKAWMKENNWAGVEKGLAGKVNVKNGFPSNYHLSFSWSEVNGQIALEILRGGGNVVMVFRRSVRAEGGDILPVEAREKGTLPTRIPIAQLSSKPEDRDWIATVIDGDETDLRFSDPYKVGIHQGGNVIGLISKGAVRVGYAGYKGYTDEKRREAFRHFTNPAILKRIGEEVEAHIVENPPVPGGGAIITLDPDLIKMTSVDINGWQIMPTSFDT